MKRKSQTILALCFLGAALIGLPGFFLARGGQGQSRMIEVTVKPGDTLWTIAIDTAPKADPRATIESIARLNGLSSARLLPGQRLLVPAEGEGEFTICSRNFPW